MDGDTALDVCSDMIDEFSALSSFWSGFKSIDCSWLILARSSFESSESVAGILCTARIGNGMLGTTGTMTPRLLGAHPAVLGMTGGGTVGESVVALVESASEVARDVIGIDKSDGGLRGEAGVVGLGNSDGSW